MSKLKEWWSRLAAGEQRTQPGSATQSNLEVRVERSGEEVTVIVVDRSGSMGSDDYAPSRLGAAIRAAGEYIAVKAARAPGDRIGVVGFNSSACGVMGIVPARDAVKAWRQACTTLFPHNGTFLEAGLRSAAELMGRQRGNHQRRIILLTDGHGGDPTAFARELKEQGTIIDVVGIGGSPDMVAEDLLKEVASVVNGELRYRFITDAKSLFEHFHRLATGIVK